MSHSHFLKILILSVCLAAVSGTLLASTSSAQEGLSADREAASDDPEEKPFNPNNYLRIFVGNMAVGAFFLLCLLYIGQTFAAIFRALKPVSAKSEDGSEDIISIFQATRYFDGGLPNIWAFLILALLLPIFLSSMSDVVPVLYPNLDRLDKEHHELFVSSSGAQIVYFMSIVTICVLITLEFSYLHNLRRNAPEWITLLLVALALDFVSLLVFNFFVQHPSRWAFEPSSETQWGMILTAFFAFCSSFLILICARTAAALNAGQIAFPIFSDDTDQEGEKTVGGTEEDG